ncbi:M1 family metallopeptidase [Streptomyces sp. SF28]|nr:M1 family metallopeptidase [Streptomyces pinistramenti]
MTVTGPGSAAAAEDTAKPGARGIGDRLFSYVGNGGYHVRSYDVAYDYRPDTTKMASSVRVDAVATQDLSEFSLDAAGMTFASVTVDGKAAAFRSKGEKLIITPAHVLPNGQTFRVEVAYTADRSAQPPSPATPSPATPDRTRSTLLSPATPPSSDPQPSHHPLSGWWDSTDKGKGFAVLGQPDRAHLFFPMNDHPSDKARVTFRITVPKNLTAVANGTLRRTTTKGDRTTYIYGTRDPIPTEVVQVAVGHYKKITATGPGGLPLLSYVPAEKIDKARPYVDQIGKQIAWVQKKIGSAYPYETYGVLVPEGDYPGAALETATRPTMALGGPNDAPTMVHELVHQYFGNAVSLKSWDDMWISEGHASYYTLRYMDETKDTPLKESMDRTYEFDQEKRPVAGPPGRLKDPGEVLGATNAPGVLMLHGLNRQVGDATFQKIEKTFFERFRNKTASTQDYINVANEVSGRDFSAYIKSWIYGAKTPPYPASTPTSTQTGGHKVRAAGPPSRT